MYNSDLNLYDKEWVIHFIKKERKKRNSVSIAILDLDFFTNIIEKIGYKNGNEVLQRIALFTYKQRKNIWFAHYGSDEFIFIFINKDKEEVAHFSELYRKKFKKERFISKIPYEKVKITFSMGIAHGIEDINKSEYVMQLLKSAETALLMAKKNGRNRIETSDADKAVIKMGKGACVTIIGDGIKGKSFDNQKVEKASLSEPYGVELDKKGDLIYVDRSNHQIKRIHRRRVYTIAGTGKNGYSNDGKNARCAELSKPSGVCVHPSGRIFIADTGNHVIRMVYQGVIDTVAGCGESGYSGDRGSAKKARLNRPGGIVVDDNMNLYTNDYGNNVIRKIDKSGKITTVVGNGSYGYTGDNDLACNASMNKPYGLCINPEGSFMYIADYGNHCIRVVDMANGYISTLCGTGEAGYSGDGGTCKAARLNGPYWVCIFKNFLYIADSNNHCIRRIDLHTNIITTIAGTGNPGYKDATWDVAKAQFCIPAGIVANNSFIYVADYGNNAIRKICISR